MICFFDKVGIADTDCLIVAEMPQFTFPFLKWSKAEVFTDV